jgi:hypothetical protein
MYTKMVFFSLLLLGYGYAVAGSSDADKLQDAIETIDLPKVKRFVKKVDQKDKPVEQRIATLKRFLQSAQDAVDEKKDNISLTGNARDLLKFIGGSVMTLVGLGLGTVAYVVEDDFFDDLPVGRKVSLGSFGVLSAVGLYTLYKGWSCSAQNETLKIARKIEDAIEDALVEVENSVPAPTK